MGVGARAAAGQRQAHRLARHDPGEMTRIRLFTLAPVEAARGVRGVDPITGAGRAAIAAMVQHDHVDQFQLRRGGGVVRQKRLGGPRIGAGEHQDAVGPAHGAPRPVGIGQARGKQNQIVRGLDPVEPGSAPFRTVLVDGRDLQTQIAQRAFQLPAAIVQIDGGRGGDERENSWL